MNITVYLGSNEGNDPVLKTAVRELGSWIGENGQTLVTSLLDARIHETMTLYFN